MKTHVFRSPPLNSFYFIFLLNMTSEEGLVSILTYVNVFGKMRKENPKFCLFIIYGEWVTFSHGSIRQKSAFFSKLPSKSRI